MYEDATKEELIEKVKQLERHVVQLKNVIAKSQTDSGGKAQRKQRPFDFTKYNTRHVALKIAYLGWDYQGFAVQEDTEKTIEAVLFDALMKTRLIESRATSNYHRCGRTDKGVSAFSQVISIDLRTKLSRGVGVKCCQGASQNIEQSYQMPPPVTEEAQLLDQQVPKTHGSAPEPEEIRYVYILNRVLPPEIRVLAWCPVDPTFSARFSCTSRTYKYIFPRGNLNLSRMQQAASALIGEHDFRNLCKMDVGNGVVTYRRHITAVNVAMCWHENQTRNKTSEHFSADNTVNTGALQDDAVPSVTGNKADESVMHLDVETGDVVDDGGYEICELTITGQAFLWHQIRCIVTVLFLIGQGLEKISIISELLDVSGHPRKPQYTMAAEFPLILFDCAYDNDDIQWQYDADSDSDTVRSMQTAWAQHSIRAAMLRRMLSELGGSGQLQTSGLVPGHPPRTYKPLFERELCESLEDRIDHYAKKQKLSVSDERVTNRPSQPHDT